MIQVNSNSELPPVVSARSWALFDRKSQQYEFGFNSNVQLEIASLTKIMTMLVALKAVEKFKLNAEKLILLISKDAVMQGGTTAHLHENDQISLQDLLYGMMLPSGNDAAYAIAENIGAFFYYAIKGKDYELIGLEDFNFNQQQQVVKKCAILQFIKEMNKLANEYQLKNTYFANPHGLSNKANKSTSYDIGKLSLIALQKDIVKKIGSTIEYQCTIDNINQSSREIVWTNTNKLLLVKGYQGLKTGNTQTALACLVTHYKSFNFKIYEDIDLVLVILGCENEELRFTESAMLIDWAICQITTNYFRKTTY